jgi:hypothetical protein
MNSLRSEAAFRGSTTGAGGFFSFVDLVLQLGQWVIDYLLNVCRYYSFINR